MKLYKYISNDLDVLKNIVKGKIKFTTVEKLNDPTELIPIMDIEQIKDSLKELRKNGFTNEDLTALRQQEILLDEIAPGMRLLDAPNTIDEANAMININVYDNINYLTSMFSQTIEQMRQNCGLFCITTRSNSLPMWAHYADKARGFVVEFEGLEERFNNHDTDVLDILLPVNYQDKRTGVTFDPDSTRFMFLTKHSDWGYEQEMRIITNLKNCNVKKNIHIMHIDPKYISKVIFGWRFGETDDQIDIDEISKELKRINPEIKCVSAKIVDGEIVIP